MCNLKADLGLICLGSADKWNFWYSFDVLIKEFIKSKVFWMWKIRLNLFVYTFFFVQIYLFIHYTPLRQTNERLAPTCTGGRVNSDSVWTKSGQVAIQLKVEETGMYIWVWFYFRLEQTEEETVMIHKPDAKWKLFTPQRDFATETQENKPNRKLWQDIPKLLKTWRPTK